MWIPHSGLTHITRALNSTGAEPASQTWTPKTMHALVWTWLGLNIAGQVLLTLLLATFFFSRRLRAQRHPIVVNFVLTWLLSTIPACLLLYAGDAEGRQPDPTVCLFNAALIAGVPPMEAVAFLAVVIQVFVMLRSVAANKTYERSTWLTGVLLSSPYVTYIAFSLIVGVIGFSDPASITRDAEIVYCSLANHDAGTYIWAFTVLIVIATFALGIWIVVLLYRNWRDVRGGKVASEFDVHLIVRALGFTIFELFILATLLLAIFNRDSIPPKFMQALAPIAVFVIFATQRDVICSWFVCLGRDAADDSSSMTRASSHLSTAAFAVQGAQPAMQAMSGRVSRTLDDQFDELSRASQRMSHFDATRASFTPRSGTPESFAPRPLMLATSALPPSTSSRTASPSSAQRPPSHMSTSSLGSAAVPRVHPHARPPRAGARTHGRSASSSTATSSVYSDASAGSATSNAPLLRTVQEYRPSTEHVPGEATYRSHAGVLGRRAGSDGKI